MYIIDAKDISANTRMWLDIAHRYSNTNSGCNKVDVGSVIVSDEGNIIALGANKSMPDCRVLGCRRTMLYGDDSKEHRLASDCNAIHSEIDALISKTQSSKGAAIYITRYPCEACARAIASSGIKRVFFGRQQPVSELTKHILEIVHIELNWVTGWDAEDAVR